MNLFEWRMILIFMTPVDVHKQKKTPQEWNQLFAMSENLFYSKLRRRF